MAKTSSSKKPAAKSGTKSGAKSPAKATPAKANSPSKSAAPARTASKGGASATKVVATKVVATKTPSKPLPAKAAPAKVEPAKVEPAKVEPATATPVSAAPASAFAPKAPLPAGTPSADARPPQPPPRPSRPPAPVTGTAAMKSLAQRNAAALRPPTDPTEISSEAQRILAENDTAAVAAIGEALASDKNVAASCRTLDDILVAKPDLLVGLVDRFVVLIGSPQKRTVQSVALALPVMARLAPARVARHLQALTERFGETNDVGKDGLVSTFAALCMASVAYQKRLEPVLELALSSAEPKTLQRWAEIILPSLKGEPHARARAVVEGRLPTMPRPLAQPIATFLGIKLRPLSP
jgi:hypothetical protein